LFKIRKALPHVYYRILQLFLTELLFRVKFKDEITMFRKNERGEKQGSVLGPVVYPICTSHLLTSDNTTTTPFDDTAILAVHEGQATASMKLQATINKVEDS
jgi:hypothetical protein